MAASALAQAPEPAPVKPVGEIFWVRARYGVTYRAGSQADIGPGLRYSGLTPNDVAASGGWFLGGGNFGAGLSVAREGFALMRTTGEPVDGAGGALYRGHLGATARIGFGPVILEALAGYGAAQLPTFGNSAAPAFSPALRHGPVVAARALLELPAELRLEVRGEYPLGLFTTPSPATSTGFAAGGALSWRAGNVGQLVYALVLDYQFITDQLVVGDTINAAQTISRAGLSLEFALHDRPPPPKYGNALVTVVDADTGARLPEPKVTVLSRGREVGVQLDGNTYRALNLDPGEVVARVTAGGYVPAEGKGTIVAGKDVAFEVRIKKEPPKVGHLNIILVDKATASPVANAIVKIRDQEYTTGPGGNLVVKDLQPGPVAITVNAPGYRPLNEVASVVVYKTSSVPLQMNQLAKKLPATITGTVRNIRGGKPVAATLEIPQASVKTLASEAGTFTIRLEGGTYTVRITADGFVAQKKSVTVKDGDQAIFNVDLHPDSRFR